MQGKVIKMPRTLLPQRTQIKINAAGLPPEEAQVPKAGEGEVVWEWGEQGGTGPQPQAVSKVAERQTGLCALYLVGTVGLWGVAGT